MRQPKNGVGVHVGSATLVMIFSVLCLTIFAVLSVVTAGNAWTLAEKSADSVTAYYEADTKAIAIYDDLTANYDGTFTLPTDCTAQVELVDGTERLNYWVSIDDNQVIWVQLYPVGDTLAIARWEVEYQGDWNADQTLNLWGG